MVETPRSAATRPIDTAPRPSAAATRTAAATIRARLRAGRGPLCGPLAHAPGRLDAGRQAGADLVVHRLRFRWGVDAHPTTVYTLRSKVYDIHSKVSQKEGRCPTSWPSRRPASRSPTARLRVLDGVDLAVARGSVLALLGPNGAGKTTTVRILATLTRADAGRARVAGFDVVADRRQVRRRISLTGQYAAVDELQTGEENLRMMGRLAGLPGPAARRRAGRAAGALRPGRGRPPARWRPTRAACAGASTWPPAWSASPRWSSWTSRPPAWTRAAARRCGRSSPSSPRTGVTVLADHPVPGGGRPAGRPHRRPRRRPGRRRRHLGRSSRSRSPASAWTWCWPTRPPSRRPPGACTAGPPAATRQPDLGVATDGSAAQVRALLDEVDPDRAGRRPVRRAQRHPRRRVPGPDRPPRRPPRRSPPVSDAADHGRPEPAADAGATSTPC